MKRILAVDDDNTALAYIEGALKPSGYEVYKQKDGRAALTALDRDEYDLVVLDFAMPDFDGFDVIAGMHKAKDMTPVIVLSSKIDAHYEAAVQAFKNVKKVLRKPCPVDRLREAVSDVVG